MNFVGLHTDEAPSTDPACRWFETMAPAEVYPQNLYEAQRSRRLQAR